MDCNPNFAAIISSIAQLLWPVLAFFIVYFFRTEFENILKRINKGKISGLEIELDRLGEATTKAKSEYDEIKVVSPPRKDVTTVETEEYKILELAKKSPKVALLILTLEIERELNAVLFGLEIDQGKGPKSVRQSFSAINNKYSLPTHLNESIDLFSQIRNRFIHGRNVSEDEIIRAIDYGISIIQTLKAIPHTVHTVFISDIQIFSDPEGKQQRQDVKGVMLTKSMSGIINAKIYPTTQSFYKEGMKVSWKWNMNKKWGESWYKDPTSKEVKYAWTSSAEFVGVNIENS